MSDDFERRLHALLAASPDPSADERFELDVRARIARLRWLRRTLPPVAAVVAVVVLGTLAAPVVVPGVQLVAETSATLSGALSGWLLSPVAYALGVLSVVVALADVLRD